MSVRSIRKIDLMAAQDQHLPELLRREWLLTNGLGGYAAGTISGSVTRRYHGLLIAALPTPHGRVVMLNHVSESLYFSDGKRVLLSGEDASFCGSYDGRPPVLEFRSEDGVPIWKYQVRGCVVEKRLLLMHGQNTAYLQYRMLEGEADTYLLVAPSLNPRPHESDVNQPLPARRAVSIEGQHYEFTLGDVFPRLRVHLDGDSASFTHEERTLERHYLREAERGYHSTGELWNPGSFRIRLRQGQPVSIVASTDSWDRVLAVDPEAAFEADAIRKRRLLSMAPEIQKDEHGAELVLAADQFIIQPAGRIADVERARAMGDEMRAIIAGYHWFTDWGRDTMISLEGLTLCTGRNEEAGWILRSYANYVRHGLIPNLFPEAQNGGLYHTADATLWYFHAVDRYLELTKDRVTLQLLLPILRTIADQHLGGTDYGIHVDPTDGLLAQGARGYQLTWMDAKVGDWVVTPRRGKPVEINALWFNALMLLQQWLREEESSDAAEPYERAAQRCRESFNRRFWNEKQECLFDVVDGEEGDDPAIRPNQVFAISLKYQVLDKYRWEPVLAIVRKELLTPVGLRSLGPHHPDFKPRYFGDLRARDAAYHQGTVWAWLIGPFIDAWLRTYPEAEGECSQWLSGLCDHLDDECVGSISEIFDAEAPYTGRGCVAQAWSVAEVLRCKVKLASLQSPRTA